MVRAKVDKLCKLQLESGTGFLSRLSRQLVDWTPAFNLECSRHESI